MSDNHLTDFQLPRRKLWGQNKNIAAPSYESFISQFGHAFPEPKYLNSDLGTTALYELPPPSGHSKHHVLILHGLNTPALGMLPLAKELQLLESNSHIVLFDLWGHGLSSTPLVPHTPQIFHFQIFQVLAYMRWTSAHVVGYSFGASIAIRYAIDNPVLSVAILAPAGLLNDFSDEMKSLLTNGDEKEAIECVLSYLEGGPLIVPEDWEQRVKSGEIVAEALRRWELESHLGYPHSVLSMFREGGVYGCEEYFQTFAGSSLDKIAIVGELDSVCSKSQLTDLGFDNVEVIEKEGHAFVRSASNKVAGIITRFWSNQS